MYFFCQCICKIICEQDSLLQKWLPILIFVEYLWKIEPGTERNLGDSFLPIPAPPQSKEVLVLQNRTSVQKVAVSSVKTHLDL